MNLPPLSPEEYDGLQESIALSGVLVPILVDCDGPVRRIIDGSHRKEIADDLGYECPEVVHQGEEDELRALARALNLARRHMNREQKRQIIADQLRETPDHTDRRMAKMLGVNHETVASVRAELEAVGGIRQLGRRVGSDGKAYKASKPGPAALRKGLEALGLHDETAILKAATQIRQQRTAEKARQQQAAEQKARRRLSGKPTWIVTGEQAIVKCGFAVIDPPFGITKEPWEPDDLEAFTRDWCRRWSKSEADFVAIFWCQENLFDGKRWFDESLKGYQFQQLLTWHAQNHCGPKSRKCLKQSWSPIFLYRKVGSTRLVIQSSRVWTSELHNLDCHVAPVPQTVYEGTELKQHPCQKPVPVMRWLINALSEPGDLVASPFCGSAPCGIAAIQLGRRYHGIEINAKYRKIAEARIAAYGNSGERQK